MKKLSFIIIFAFFFLSVFSKKNLNDSSAVISGRVDVEYCSKIKKTPTYISFSYFNIHSFSDTTLRSQVDSSGYFRISFPISTINYITLKIELNIGDTIYRCGRWLNRSEEYVNNILRRSPQLYLLKVITEPGDSLNLDLEINLANFPILKVKPENIKVIYSGKKTSVKNNNFYLKVNEQSNNNSIGVIWDNKKTELFDLEIKEAMSICDYRLRESLNVLNEHKDNISSELYQLTKTDYIFASLHLKHTLVRAYLYSDTASSSTKRKQSRELYGFMDDVEFKDEYMISSKYRGFLGAYIEYLLRIIYGEDKPVYINGYYLAKAAFRGETRKLELSRMVDFILNHPENLEQNIIYYYDFINTYPTGKLSENFKNYFLKKQKVFSGAIPPDLIISDSKGRTKSLHNLKNKVVVITPEYHYNGNLITELNEKKYKEVIFIGLETENSFAVDLKEFYTDFDYLAYEKLNTNSYEAYVFNSATYTLINKEGKIVKHFSPNPRIKKNLDKAIEEELAKRYTLRQKTKSFLQRNVFKLTIIFSVLISIVITLLFVSEIKKRRLRTRRMQLQGEIKALRAQLNPHFLFNSISSIQNYIRRSDTDTAINHIGEFSKLMRMTLEFSEKEFLTLNEEYTYYTSYVKLEAMRHGFQYSINIDKDIDKYNTEIPGMLLQPFIENAIIHGISGLGKKGILEISFKPYLDNLIQAVVTDNGQGYYNGIDRFGLKSSRERIDLLNSQYKKRIALSITNKSGNGNTSGLVVELLIPRKY